MDSAEYSRCQHFTHGLDGLLTTFPSNCNGPRISRSLGPWYLLCSSSALLKFLLAFLLARLARSCPSCPNHLLLISNAISPLCRVTKVSSVIHIDVQNDKLTRILSLLSPHGSAAPYTRFSDSPRLSYDLLPISSQHYTSPY